MRLLIDDVQKTLTIETNGEKKTNSLYSKEAFEIISHQWLKIGWNEKYPYTFNWMGRPIIQLPEDIIRIQEVIYRIKPDVIVETGIAHGGSLIFYASLFKAMGKGRAIGVDIEIRPHNRTAIEAHELFSYITLIEGDSTDKGIVNQVKQLIEPDEIVLVILDSNHSKQHVLKELKAYSPLVTKGSFIVATDGLMKDLYDVPRGKAEWAWDNPTAAAIEFVNDDPRFIIEKLKWDFNESELTDNITHWPGAYLRRIR
ncbi:MAG: cephalosporin hydroxylase family protein [Candidatus Methanoperedenaceae archaeon]|nr:cephalosporin hydroxylase family protein [Candidatus Methanoperedenaceae archaeon]